MVPPVEQEECYDVQTGIRRRVRSNLIRRTGSGKFSSRIYTDLCGLEKQVRLCGNQCESCGSYTTGGEALSIKVAKNSLAYVGMFVGNGKKGAEVTAIDKSNANYDVLTIKLLLVRILPKMLYYSMRLQLMV